MSKVKEFLFFFFMQIVVYALVDMSSRWVAQGNIPLGVSSSMVYAALAFLVLKKIAKDAATLPAISGYVCGSGVGTFLGIVVSRAVTGI